MSVEMQAPHPISNKLSKDQRVRIIGQGLCGSLLALNLHDRGIPFVVQDVDMPGSATAVAPGIVNPLAGRNFRPPEFIDELIGQMDKAMELVKHKLQVDVWNPTPILRMFAEPTQVDRFERSRKKFNVSTFVEEEYPANTFDHLNDVYGSFLTIGGGWADLPLLMKVTRDWLRREGLLEEVEWIPQENKPTENASADEIVVFCEGWRVAENPHWSFIPHNPAKGEMLIVRFTDEMPRDRIYNQSCWAQPIEGDLWRVGATYSWDAFDSNATLDAATQLQENLNLMTQLKFDVENQVAGVRPIVDDYKPIVGRHPDFPHWYIVNALGSKGVLQAPTAVKDFLDNLLEGSRIPSDWSVDRFV